MIKFFRKLLRKSSLRTYNVYHLGIASWWKGVFKSCRGVGSWGSPESDRGEPPSGVSVRVVLLRFFLFPQVSQRRDRFGCSYSKLVQETVSVYQFVGGQSMMCLRPVQEFLLDFCISANILNPFYNFKASQPYNANHNIFMQKVPPVALPHWPQVVIVVAETGSGKTTQITQYLHEAGHDDCSVPTPLFAQRLPLSIGNQSEHSMCIRCSWWYTTFPRRGSVAKQEIVQHWIYFLGVFFFLGRYRYDIVQV